MGALSLSGLDAIMSRYEHRKRDLWLLLKSYYSGIREKSTRLKSTLA